MPERSPTLPPPSLVTRTYSPLAGFLSYLLPGLGQIYQGRIGKGLLFLVCVPGLFVLGMALGDWKNVYLPDTTALPRVSVGGRVAVEGPLKAVYYRVQYLGQFWAGVAAWPAILQYVAYDPHRESGPLLGTFERAPSEQELNDLQRDGDKHWDLGWVYTVIAGVLNILVVYDAFAGPLFLPVPRLGLSGEATS